MAKKILVAGGAGYIGSHVQKQLLEEGFEVLIYDNLSTGNEVNILKGAEFIRGDILDKERLNNAWRRILMEWFTWRQRKRSANLWKNRNCMPKIIFPALSIS